MSKQNKKVKTNIEKIKTEKIEIEVLRSSDNVEEKIEIKNTEEADEILGGKGETPTTIIVQWPTNPIS